MCRRRALGDAKLGVGELALQAAIRGGSHMPVLLATILLEGMPQAVTQERHASLLRTSLPWNLGVRFRSN